MCVKGKRRISKVHFYHHSKTCVKRPLKIDKTKVLMTNGSLMKLECIAGCYPWSILQYFWPAFENQFSTVFLRVVVLQRLYCFPVCVQIYSNLLVKSYQRNFKPSRSFYFSSKKRQRANEYVFFVAERHILSWFRSIYLKSIGQIYKYLAIPLDTWVSNLDIQLMTKSAWRFIISDLKGQGRTRY